MSAVGEQGGGVFRRSDPQGSLFESSNLLPDEKRQRLEREWPGQFRDHALPLIDEEEFRDLYCPDNGRPNKPVRTVIGVLVLKEMFDLTDEDTLGSVDYDLRWQVALNLTPEDAHCCQKTLHNFRAKLLGNDKAKQLFAGMTDKMLQALGLSAARQRLDSTHIVSNIARLTRLGLFCETIRVFLRELQKSAPQKFQRLPEPLRQRYLKTDGADSPYHDAKSLETQRRLKVCARDVYRLSCRFEKDKEVLKWDAYNVLLRLLEEQCEIIATNAVPEQDDADAQDAPVPVVLKESKEVSAASLQSPHDVDATYSGHKGKGYEVQVAETVGNGEKPELITHVETTPSCQSDEAATVPTVEALAQREIQPQELITDTNYASAANVMACEQRGTEVVAPVKGPAAEAPQENEKTLADFTVDQKAAQPVLCPAGHAPESLEQQENGSISATFSRLYCAQCPFRKTCPAKRNANGTRTLKTTLKEHVLAKRRRYEQTEEFRKRYAERAGIEATNSELKRAHGMGFLRVRGGARVKLAVYFKALACNVKRLVAYLAQEAKKAAKEPGQTNEQAAASLKAATAALFGCVRYSGALWRAVRRERNAGPFALAA
jgi:hypothetical protein